MPRWETHSGSWFSARWRYDIKGRLGEIFTGILPVAVVERFYHRDFTEEAYGAGTQSWDSHIFGDPNAPNHYHSVALHNPVPFDDATRAVECLVYRVEGGIMIAGLAGGAAGHPLVWNPIPQGTGGGVLRLYTALESYFDNSGPATYTPSQGGSPVGSGIYGGWLQMGVGPPLNQLHNPTAHLDAGVHDVLPVVSVGGVNNFAVGPVMQSGSGGGGQSIPAWVVFDAGSRPYLRLKPGQRLVLQSYNRFNSDPNPTVNQTCLFASFWWIERPWREGL